MSWNKKDTIKIITIDIRADKLIQLVIKIIGKKIVAHTKVKLKLYANKTPAIVATAFPPLILKIWRMCDLKLLINLLSVKPNLQHGYGIV